MVSDDFSFPTTTNPSPCFAGSPPLWNVSYGITGESRDEEHQRRKSFPMAERDMKIARDSISKDDEERMDLLWENFNDELLQIPSFDKNKEQQRLRKEGELDCVKAWKMSKTNGAGGFSRRRPSLLTMMKVMKKMFLLHNSHRPKKSIS